MQCPHLPGPVGAPSTGWECLGAPKGALLDLLPPPKTCCCPPELQGGLWGGAQSSWRWGQGALGLNLMAPNAAPGGVGGGRQQAGGDTEGGHSRGAPPNPPLFCFLPPLGHELVTRALSSCCCWANPTGGGWGERMYKSKLAHWLLSTQGGQGLDPPRRYTWGGSTHGTPPNLQSAPIIRPHCPH